MILFILSKTTFSSFGMSIALSSAWSAAIVMPLVLVAALLQGIAVAAEAPATITTRSAFAAPEVMDTTTTTTTTATSGGLASSSNNVHIWPTHNEVVFAAREVRRYHYLMSGGGKTLSSLATLHNTAPASALAKWLQHQQSSDGDATMSHGTKSNNLNEGLNTTAAATDIIVLCRCMDNVPNILGIPDPLKNFSASSSTSSSSSSSTAAAAASAAAFSNENKTLLAKGVHALRTVHLSPNLRVHLLTAPDTIGVLYAAYAFAEALGARFSLTGDVLPSPENCDPNDSIIPNLSILASPTFEKRGLQPFHDFASGPDWWTGDDYKHIFTQLTKMRMNFLGLHTYPYSNTLGTGKDEPTVWVGLKEDVTTNGSVTRAYPTSYANTHRAEWGMSAMNTSDMLFGASQVFDAQCYGSPVQKGKGDEAATACPFPNTEAESIAVFERTADMLGDAFRYAKKVGVLTAVGTETPLSTPPQQPSSLNPLRLYYSASRNDNFVTTTDCAECENEYVFQGVIGTLSSNATAMPLSPRPFSSSSSSFSSYSASSSAIPLSTCYSATKFDNMLVRGSDKSACPPGYGFVRLEGWAHANSTSASDVELEMFYNAARNDHLVVSNASQAAAAKAAGYVRSNSSNSLGLAFAPLPVPSTQDFYEGIFTRVMRATPVDLYWIWTPEGWEWGKMTSDNPTFKAAVNDLDAALRAHDAVNASFGLATCGWVLGPLPDRTIFDKVLSSRYAAISSIDMSVGNTPVDPAYAKVTRHPKWAIPWMEDDPGLTAPEIWVNRTLEHMEDAAKYGCDGLLGIHWRTGVTAPAISAMGQKSWNAALTSTEFWLDWAKAEFGNGANGGGSGGGGGSGVAARASSIFATALDSYKAPRPVNWIGGPGGMRADTGQCAAAASDYGFVDAFAALGPQVVGASERARFQYWNNTLVFFRALAQTECAWGVFANALKSAQSQPTPAARKSAAEAIALPSRVALVRNASVMITALLGATTNRGEQGTVRNVWAHSLIHALTETAVPLAQLLGTSKLPPDALPSSTYAGPVVVANPTPRTSVLKGEALTVEIFVVSDKPTAVLPTLNYRPMASATSHSSSSSSRGGAGGSTFTSLPMNAGMEGRGIWRGIVPPQADDWEYYVSIRNGNQVWPAGGASSPHTVVLM